MENEKQIEEQFASLPFEEKVSSLFKMELATITEAINYVVREPMKVAEKIGGIAVEFGKRVEAEFREARKHRDDPAPGAEKKKSGKKAGESANTSDDAGTGNTL